MRLSPAARRPSGWARVQGGFALLGSAGALDRDVTVERLSEEHGLAVVGAAETVELGEKPRFVPAHACTAVNLSDELYGLRGERVEVVWPVAARGKRA